MRRSARLVRFSTARRLAAIVAVLLGASLLAAIPASAATTAPVTGLELRAGYNSVQLDWNPPQDSRQYGGVSIWRFEGNVDPEPAPVLVAKLDASHTEYVDRGLTTPASKVWGYTVYTRDTARGGVTPQTRLVWVTAAVAGRVTDAHGNGLAGVHVVAGAGQAWSTVGETNTAPDGSYLIDGIDWSSVVVCFDARRVTGGASTTGYLSECYNGVPSIPYHGRGGESSSLILGALTAGIDAKLDPAGVVAGVLRDVQGRPLANAGVSVVRSDEQVDSSAMTGSDGRYRIIGLPAGQYTSCGFQPYTGMPISPGSPSGYLSTCSDGSTAGTPAKSFPVTVGGSTTANVAMVVAGAISGRLFGPDGKPVAGELPELGGGYAPEARISATDVTGAYRVTGLRPGRYTVCFQGSRSTGTGDTFDPGRAPQCWQNVEPTSPTNVDVTLGQWVKGVDVTEYANPAIAGRVVDTSARPVSGVLVTVDGNGATTTETDGTYRVGVTPGTHTVCFDASQATGASTAGYDDQCWKAQARFGGTPTPVVTPRGAAVTGIDAVLATAAGVRVKVVNAFGHPLRNAIVFLYHQGEGPNARTNASGIATFTRVYTGAGSDYLAYLEDDSYWDAVPQAPFGYATAQKAVTVKPGMTSVQILAPASGTVSGTVRDTSGAPVSAAQIEVAGTSYLGGLTTGADGTWALSPVPPGTYTFCASSWVGSGSSAHDATSCWKNATSSDTATPVVVGDRQAVTGIDTVLH